MKRLKSGGAELDNVCICGDPFVKGESCPNIVHLANVVETNQSGDQVYAIFVTMTSPNSSSLSKRLYFPADVHDHSTSVFLSNNVNATMYFCHCGVFRTCS